MNRLIKKIFILGERYTITTDEELKDCDGLADKSIRELKICKTLFEESIVGELQNKLMVVDKVARHEVIHAFLYESGLQECSNFDLEQMVDWIAIMYPKMEKIFKKLEIDGD